MKQPSRADLLEFALDAAWRAGRLTLAHFGTGIAAEAKADASPVTEADRAAERLLRELIEARFPDDGILGEEFGETRPGARRTWILDPIDGTRSFVRGVPLYGTLVGIEEDGEAIAGVIHMPALGESVYAARGLGCWADGRRALVSAVDGLDRALVLASSASPWDDVAADAGWNRLRARAGAVRTWGDCYGYALVATGRAEAMIDAVVSPWDVAAVQPIIEEAGGVFTDLAGQATHRGGSAIGTNAALARDVRAAFDR